MLTALSRARLRPRPMTPASNSSPAILFTSPNASSKPCAPMAETNLKPPSSTSKPLHGKDDDAIERRTLRDYFIILRERFWIALPLALLVVLPYGYFQAHQPKMYQARATMEFEKPERVITTEGVVDPSIKSEGDLNTYIEDLTSDR